MALKSNIVDIKEFLNPLLSKKKVEGLLFEDFKTKLLRYISSIKSQHQTNQSEPNIVSNSLKPFIDSLGYNTNVYSQEGQSGIDLAIMKENKPCVIIEAKKHQDKDMITKDDLLKKSFFESILYFMRERDRTNQALFHIIITDFYNWFVFDAKDFERLFWQNRQINKIYKDWKNPSLLGDKTKHFYESIQNSLKDLKIDLFNDMTVQCAYFNLLEEYDDKKMLSLYKLLGSDSLLKEFNPNDANSLNRGFYNELLYILGLEETKEKSKKLISCAKKPQIGSFYENISNKLLQYNKKNDFETIIKLLIIWINRILFLKLLESQIVSWNNNKEYKFLNTRKIPDFDTLETLFFEVLAKKVSERRHREFDYIPYLNSSLFEIHKDEDRSLTISNLSDDAKVEYYSKTVIKDEYGKKKQGEVSTLSYLFEFLDAYDFGTTAADEISSESKSLINASVLGLIFEKINGYKDGSFYTPSFITMYMSKESLQKSIIHKFNTAFGIEAKDFEELKNYCYMYNYKTDFLQKANSIIDSVTVCDPAVGSGHFLVSMLNEIIYAKAELGILKSPKGTSIRLENDELHVKLEDEWFEYKSPKDFSNPNHMLQKMLFEEKQRIIENQLFGVDINPNSSQITKLRLWIELLKNSYYDTNYQLVTLPNIDINIKTGNSLISRFDLKDEIKINNIKHEIKNYKERVRDYKENIGTKKEVLDSIESLKNKFRLTLKAESKAIKERNVKLKEYVEIYKHEKLPDELILVAIKNNYNLKPTLFDEKTDVKKQSKLFEELSKLQHKIDEIEKGKIYEDAFEWRFEFPEVLDEEGNFVGFDIVIGNPPYIMEDDNKSAFDGLREKVCYQGKTDIWHIFTCQGLGVLKENGLISYIAKNQWLESQSASNMRKTIYQNGNILSIIDFGTNMVFEEASQQTMIFLIQKDRTNEKHHINYKKVIGNISNEKIAKILHETEDENLKTTTKEIPKNYEEKANLTFSSSQNEEILSKIESFKNFEFDEKKEMIQGIIGGPDDAFIVNEDKLDNFSEDEKIYLKMLHTNTEKYFTPDIKQYIFYISAKNFKDKNIDDFSNIKANLLPYKEKLDNRRETLSGQKEWYHLWWERDESFFKEGDKIVFAARTNGSNFTFTSEPFYGSRNLFFIKSERVNLRYITALLNSKLMYFYMHERLKHTGDLLQIDKNQFMKIPLFIADEKSVNEISIIADEILSLKKENPKADTSELEKQIDDLVYKLYDLTDVEIDIIENNL